MKLLKKILLIAGVLLVVLIVVSQFLPSTFHVERSAVIAAKAEAIHPWINNLKKWPEWTAWTVAKDPSLIFAYEGPEEGVGAISKWEGKKMGQGQMKVVESDAAKGLKCDLSFDHGKMCRQVLPIRRLRTCAKHCRLSRRSWPQIRRTKLCK